MMRWRLRKKGALSPSGTLLCIGHSHVACVANAAELAGVPLQALNFWSMPGAISKCGDQFELSDTLVRQLEQHNGPVFSMLGGSAHGVLGLLVHPRRFDFVLPAQPTLPLDAAAELLPLAVVRSVLESLMVDYLGLMAKIHTFCQGRLFQLEPPPPYANGQRMMESIPWSMYPGMVHEISPAYFRYKLWRLHSQIVMDWCAQNDAEFVPCPPESIDQQGFLREPYYGDGAHAGTAYGALVLEQMKRLA
jgi:hypothetical protein